MGLIMSERKSLQVYRNINILNNITEAETEFSTLLTKDVKDGEVLAVRYYADSEKKEVKTLLGLVYVDTDGKSQITRYSETPSYIGNGDFSQDTELANLDLTNAILKLKEIIDGLNTKYVQYGTLE